MMESYNAFRDKVKRRSQQGTKADEKASAAPIPSSSSFLLNSKPPPTTPFAKIHHHKNSQNGKLVVAAIQITASSSSDNDIDGFWERATASVLAAAQLGATLILLPELFLGPYFCQSQECALQDLADEGGDQNFILSEFQIIAKQLGVVLPISFYERKNNALYNSVTVIDADGSLLNKDAPYRKSHIPDGPGYQEKFYFTPGDSGFQVVQTKFGKIGVGICWDQWFPEAARSMALLGADILLYPTAIGTEPQDPTIDSSDHWQRVMQGHAAANMIPVVAANRYGTEVLLEQSQSSEQSPHLLDMENKIGREEAHPTNTSNNTFVYKEKQRIRFYGRSFITDETGAIIKEALPGSDIILAPVDIVANRATRAAWGLFRDRRPELYGVLRTKDGSQPML